MVVLLEEQTGYPRGLDRPADQGWPIETALCARGQSKTRAGLCLMPSAESTGRSARVERGLKRREGWPGLMRLEPVESPRERWCPARSDLPQAGVVGGAQE